LSSNITDATQSLAKLIFNFIQEDKELKKIICSEEQITTTIPSSIDKAAQISIFLYRISEATIMRNQLQNPNQPRTILYLNLHYLITPLTRNTKTDQLILCKILQLFAEKPILRNTDFQGSLRDSETELKITLDQQTMADINNLWTMLQTQYKLSICYTVTPIELKSETKSVSIRNTPLTAKTKKEKSA
jgi:hypothetical protein